MRNVCVLVPGHGLVVSCVIASWGHPVGPMTKANSRGAPRCTVGSALSECLPVWHLTEADGVQMGCLGTKGTWEE